LGYVISVGSSERRSLIEIKAADPQKKSDTGQIPEEAIREI
jgi:hypothetical protein